MRQCLSFFRSQVHLGGFWSDISWAIWTSILNSLHIRNGTASYFEYEITLKKLYKLFILKKKYFIKSIEHSCDALHCIW